MNNFCSVCKSEISWKDGVNIHNNRVCCLECTRKSIERIQCYKQALEEIAEKRCNECCDNITKVALIEEDE